MGDNRAAMKTLADWLAHCEQLHPKTIDMGLARSQEVVRRMGLVPNCPVITVAGTNGKGSTCAMLESILLQAGYKVGVYSSPHLVHFEERCRIKGEICTADQLLPGFEAVEAARGEISLSYFEFTTLAIVHAMNAAQLDVMVLEVGLGGRLDTVNVFDADCAVITSIDLDHTELLGKTRDAIGVEKAGIMRPGKAAVVSDPVPPQSVIDHANAIGADLWLMGRDYRFAPAPGQERQQWNWQGRHKRYSSLAYPALRGANQLGNAAGVLAALEALHRQLPVTAQAIRVGLGLVALPGRFQIVPGQPNLILDVAHNPHAVAALAENLDAMGFFPNTHAVFGAMADKDYAAILQRMDPLVEHWYFADLPTPRAATAEQLDDTWRALTQRPDAQGKEFADPQQALDAAIAAAAPTDRIVVFGSFYTVGGILQHGTPRMPAPHASH